MANATVTRARRPRDSRRRPISGCGGVPDVPQPLHPAEPAMGEQRRAAGAQDEEQQEHRRPTCPASARGHRSDRARKRLVGRQGEDRRPTDAA